MELHLKIVGGLLIGLALLHGVFPRYFQWRNDLAGLTLINRQMMYVHTFFIALMVFLMGLLCLTSAREITGTPLEEKLHSALRSFGPHAWSSNGSGTRRSSGGERHSRPRSTYCS